MKQLRKTFAIALALGLLTLPAMGVAAAWTGTKSQWNGCDRFDFSVDGRPCHVVVPKKVAHGRPWVWRARFPNYHTEVDLLLLKRGFHVAHMNTGGMFGSDKALAHWDAFYRQMTASHGLARRAVLEAVSRGGLFAYRWAARHPGRVACIYGDVPVLDFKSWPLGQGKGIGSKQAWQQLLGQYGLTHANALKYTGNPLDNLAPLAAANIPLYHVVALNDRVVPPQENTLLLQKQYRRLGGEITVETIPKGTAKSNGHHFDRPDPATAAKFILMNSFDHLPGEKDYFRLRGGLNNCRITFERHLKGRVVFMGGSITNMTGWRQMVCGALQRRFPKTKFEFINAGIPSTGSVPGAFRLARDVLARGEVDLLFEEAAVNDGANRPVRSAQWLRGMEGILRQALRANPQMDIVVMHFVDPGKVADYHAGKTPAVIAAHERAAAHCGVNSISLSREVADRIRAGQFTWKQDFRNLHPSRYGHRLYTATIERMFDAAWAEPLEKDAKPVPHKLPRPLDKWSYARPKLVAPTRAAAGKGWRLVEKWRPTGRADRGGTRPGFVNVPMLVADKPGAELTFAFEGTAVGLWIIAGPDVGIIDYRIDGGAWQQRDQFTPWSGHLHLPWTLVLADELPDGKHTLTLCTNYSKNRASRGHACRIVLFCVNGPRTTP